MIDIVYTNNKELLAFIWTSWLSFLAWMLGGFDLLIYGLVGLMVLDFISGVLVGYKTETLNSKKGSEGLKKKIMVWLIIACSSIFSQILNCSEIRNMVAIFYCAIEILSVIENAAKLGVPIPNKLKKALEQCREEKDIKTTEK